MPILVQVDELQPGMRLYEPLVSAGRVMLQSGIPLTPSDISALKRRYPGLCVRVGDPILDDVVEFEDDARDRQIAARVQAQIAESMSQVHERFTDRAALKGTDFEAVHSAVNELIAFLRSNPASTALIARCLDKENYLSTHTGNVFYLSMLLGSAVLDYVATERRRQTLARDLRSDFAMDLTPLGLGAMVMDLAMIPLQHLFKQDAPLTEADRAALLEHPSVGADMLPENFPPAARMIVRTHHENFDGSGYPKRVCGEKVHVFTRIVRIADAYDAATSESVYKQAKSAPRALWEMTYGPYRRYFDPALMKAFAGLIQPFPIGSKLKLEDGRHAIVVKYNHRHPFQPVAVVAFDVRNRPIPHRDLEPPVSIGSRPDLKIRLFREEDLSYIYDVHEGSEAARSARDFRTVLDAAYP